MLLMGYFAQLFKLETENIFIKSHVSVSTIDP